MQAKEELGFSNNSSIKIIRDSKYTKQAIVDKNRSSLQNR